MPTEKNMRFKQLKLFRELFPYFWVPQWAIRARIITSLALTALMICLDVATPLVLKMVINLLPLSPQTNVVLILIIVYGLMWMLSRIANDMREIILYRAMERSIHSMTLRLFERLQMLSMSFHLDRKTGSITSAIERIHKAFPDIIWSLVVLVPTVLEILVAVIILWYLYGVVFGLALLTVLVGAFLVSIIGLNLISGYQQQHYKRSARATAFMVDSLLNFETVKYFGNQKYETDRCNEILQEREDATTIFYELRGWIGLGQNAILGLGLLFVSWKSGYAVYSGQLAVGDFVAINAYLLQFVVPAQYFSYYLRQISRGLGDMEHAVNLLHTKPEIINAPHAVPLIISDKAEVVFDHVSFGYSTRGLILKDISFTVPAGKMVAIVGSTGAGKSTISRLLFRFYDVSGGRILINGQDIRTVTQDSLRRAIGIVPQDTVLFNNTLYYNIAYARPDANKEEVERAINMAHLDSFVSRLPDGYNAMVGERGLKLSGGEKQRVAIARVFLKQPKIYVFDEATSALDTVTERSIQRNLEEVSAGSTTVVIAHRLSTVVHADEIIVLDQGRVAQRGTHRVLLQDEQGLYARLWRKQIMCPD